MPRIESSVTDKLVAEPAAQQQARRGPAMGMGAASVAAAAGGGVRIEALSAATIPGANAVHNEFMGAGKRLCLCPYSCCPESDDNFSEKYDTNPELFETTAVAVREGSGEVVGCMVMSVHGQPRGGCDECIHETKPGECYIEWLAVASSARGMGVGTKLLLWGDALARQWRCTSLTLGVVNGNPARRLYERQGFVLVPQVQNHLILGPSD